MTTLLIGHRGTGKTSFLRGLAGTQTFDLDAEIENAEGRSIGEIFKDGEDKFRLLERATLERIVKAARGGEPVVAVGAGFEGPIPDGARVVWLQRPTDFLGRCFLDRPRLDPKLSPLAEYRERFFERERRFAEWAGEQVVLPEGYERGLEDILQRDLEIPYEMTLLPGDFRDLKAFLARRQVRRWELRDDLLTQDQIELALKEISREKILYSRRAQQGEVPAGIALDWPLELGEPPAKTSLISLHEREEDFASTLIRISSYNLPLKLSVEIKDFTELKAGHEWWLKDPSRRSFLPRSAKGRWRWYRSLFGPRMPLHFIREGAGSSLDQPLLWQCYLQPEFKTDFAAVIGSPVEHSRSPLEQREFAKDIPFVAIDVPEEEFSVALRFLEDLGLRFAAVTAPLKKLAWAQAHLLSNEARKTQAVNSLYFDHGKIFAHNTDVLALHELSKELTAAHSVWLWGGGGVKSSVRQIWPDAIEIPARQGTERTPPPDLLIWATGRSRTFVFPDVKIRPKLVLDLNYSQDSPGLEWAVRENLPYQSGLRMFKLQAEFQRRFWCACAKGEWP
jgi:shikimate kinase